MQTIFLVIRTDTYINYDVCDEDVVEKAFFTRSSAESYIENKNKEEMENRRIDEIEIEN